MKVTPPKSLSRIAKILLMAVCPVVVGVGVYWIFASSFSLTGDTWEKVVMEQHSPNDAYIASVGNSGGGATVSNSTFVCIRLKGEKLKETKESVVFRVEDITKVGIHWDNDAQLTVDYDPRIVMYKIDHWRGVKLLYVEHRLY